MTEFDQSERFAAVSEAISTRRSIRGFLDRQVDPDLVVRVLELASRAPSGSNIQPWKTHVVTGRSLTRLKEALSAVHFAGVPEKREYEYYPTVWRSPFLERRRKIGLELYRLTGVARGDQAAALGQRGATTSFSAPLSLSFSR